jgi:hypothetical protein
MSAGLTLLQDSKNDPQNDVPDDKMREDDIKLNPGEDGRKIDETRPAL